MKKWKIVKLISRLLLFIIVEFFVVCVFLAVWAVSFLLFIAFILPGDASLVSRIIVFISSGFVMIGWYFMIKEALEVKKLHWEYCVKWPSKKQEEGK